MANLAYLDTIRFEDGKSLRGGLLVVDEATEPLEFRCTSVVRPTPLQAILWGARLDAHITASLLGKPLLEQTQKEYAAVLVRDGDMLELRENLSVPVIQLRRDSDIEYEHESKVSAATLEPQGKAPGGEREGSENGLASAALLSHALGRFEPIVITPHPQHKADRDTVRAILAPVFECRDVMEPFDRIRTALKEIHAQESKKAPR